jgi:hypothetical protein
MMEWLLSFSLIGGLLWEFNMMQNIVFLSLTRLSPLI